MGKGDKKSRRGKITIGSYGVRRRRRKVSAPPVVEVKPTPVKKTVKKSPEVPVIEEKEVKTTVVAEAEAKPAKKKAAPKAVKKEKPVKDKPKEAPGE
jgi:30S ribosomal protein S31